MNTTVLVEWQHNEWQLYQWPNLDEPTPLNTWAKHWPDGSSIRVILSAQNVNVRWVSMPGVKSRHVHKALPFALEEGLVEDLDRYVLLAGQHHDQRTQAYTVDAALVNGLVEAFELHHVHVTDIVCETQLLPDQAMIQRWRGGWLVSIPDALNTWVDDALINPILDEALTHHTISRLTIRAAQLDHANLLKTTLETGYADTIKEVIVEATNGMHTAEHELAQKKMVDLLQGRGRISQVKEVKQASWWRPILVMSGFIFVIWYVSLLIESHHIKAQADSIHSQSVSLYKRLFSGERIRSLERQFKSKLEQGNQPKNRGFLYLMDVTARVYGESHQRIINFDSIRFNDRTNDLVVELRVKNIAQLQKFKQDLEKSGLQAEISSASNDKQGVKGRMKIKEAE